MPVADSILLRFPDAGRQDAVNNTQAANQQGSLITTKRGSGKAVKSPAIASPVTPCLLKNVTQNPLPDGGQHLFTSLRSNCSVKSGSIVL